MKQEKQEISEHQSSSQSSVIKHKCSTDIFMYQAHTTKKDEARDNFKQLRQFIQSMGFQIFITFLALYSLFSDDIRMAAFDASADLAFDVIHILLMIVFLIEMGLSWVSLADYKWSFYFFLDLVSSLSLLLDISMITDLMYSNNSSSYNLSQLAAQSRASRVATRAVRIVKLVRIIRIVKMYKSASKAAQIKQQIKKKRLQQKTKKQNLKNKNQNDEIKTSIKQNKSLNIQNHHEQTQLGFVGKDIEKHEIDNEMIKQKIEGKQQEDFLLNGDLIDEVNKKESKISKMLSDLTVKKVIIVVLLIMFLVPLFDTDNYIQRTQSMDYTVSNVYKLLKNSQVNLQNINNLINSVIENRSDQKAQNYIIYFSTPFEEIVQYQHNRFGKQRTQDLATSIEEINVQEILSIRPTLTLKSNTDETTKNQIYAVTNYRANNQKDAIFSMAKTLFICIVLVGMLHFFTEDINELIVRPTEEMMNHVMQIAKNPQAAATSEINNDQYQTALVHNAILKIGALLSLVFGSAGAQIVGSNIMKQGDMNPMIEGKKKCAIFGFCDIRNFTQITQVLQEDIMLFVNKIGELVHSSVYRYGGSANKNIGQAFLLVWPLPDDSYTINNKDNQITWHRKKYISLMADFSVFSFTKALVKIHKEPRILQYRTDERLTSIFGDNYQVKMGFGLHIGWAIQGAIGSEYKIDASYLSPNVNMASRLEAATKQFGVDLLISEDLFKMLTPGLQKFCRNIDKVTVKGSAKPIKLYTIDMNLENISPSADKKIKYKNPDDQLDVQIKKQINMQYFEQEKIDKYDSYEFISRKKQLRQVLINALPQDFYKRFQKGLQCYLEGNWSDSHLHLTEALKIGKNDGPTKNIINYMKKFDFIAPSTWSNYRPLTSK